MRIAAFRDFQALKTNEKQLFFNILYKNIEKLLVFICFRGLKITKCCYTHHFGNFFIAFLTFFFWNSPREIWKVGFKGCPEAEAETRGLPTPIAP